MESTFARRAGWLRVSFAILALALTGCAAVGERVAGWYVTRQLDGYLDLTSAQKHAARARVDEAIDALRRDELPAWVSFLREARQGIHEGLTEESIARLQRHYDARLDAGVALLAPRLAPILAELSPSQLDHFARRLHEEVDEHYEERELPEAKRKQQIEKRALEVVEDVVGDLSDAQADVVRRTVRSLPDERPAQYRSALANIARFRRFMAQKPSAERIDAELRAMWEQRYDGLGPDGDKSSRRVWQRKALYDIARILDAKQRAHAEDELTERIRLLKRFLVAS